jgi:hypothetical protein
MEDYSKTDKSDCMSINNMLIESNIPLVTNSYNDSRRMSTISNKNTTLYQNIHKLRIKLSNNSILTNSNISVSHGGNFSINNENIVNNIDNSLINSNINISIIDNDSSSYRISNPFIQRSGMIIVHKYNEEYLVPMQIISKDIVNSAFKVKLV